ncbi:MAG: SLC13 family permease, partial [Planctomycetales bacterium]|nr:SLC13 family permease [Planctomycetales bacterium]
MRSDVLALSVLCVLGIAGYFAPNTFLAPLELLTCFSDPAPITIAAMFVLGAGLTRTGALEGVAQRLTRLARHGEAMMLLGLMVVVIPVSCVLNNTAVVVFFLPIVLAVCTRRNIAASRLLIPLSYASMFGGIFTLIGTSTNIVVNNVAARYLDEPLRLFEPSRMGILFALTGGAYLLLIGRRLLPSRETLTTLLGASHAREFRTEVVIMHGSPLIGQALEDARRQRLRSGTIVGVTRNGVLLEPPFEEIKLKA